MTKKETFLTDDITCMDWENDNPERYTYFRDKYSFIEYIKQNKDKTDKDLDSMPISKIIQKYQSLWDKWSSEASPEEVYSIPMMNCLRYYPSFVEFTEDDAEECSGATCLVYDNELGAWAVGMSGGGMDLSAHLLETFINLGKGIPTELAKSISINNNAYVNKEVHKKNCELLATAFERESENFKHRAKDLKH